MRMRALAVGLVALCVAAGCAQAPAKEGETEKPELSPQLKSLVLDQAPTDIAHPLYIDFNGRAELLGYAIDPEPAAGTKLAPNTQLSLKLYWRATGKLDGGYVPFTEVVSANGKRTDVDGAGPVRKGELVPSNWETGKVYIDELSVPVPNVDGSRVSIVVGLKTEPVAPEEAANVPEPDADDKKADKKVDKPVAGNFGTVYLSVLSGPADSKHGGVVTSFETLRVPKEDKKALGGALKRPPAGRPVSAKPLARPSQPAQ
jgi:hypothetical protein